MDRFGRQGVLKISGILLKYPNLNIIFIKFLWAKQVSTTKLNFLNLSILPVLSYTAIESMNGQSNTTSHILISDLVGSIYKNPVLKIDNFT